MSDETIEPLGDKEYVGPSPEFRERMANVSPEWLLRMAEMEDKSPCTSVGGFYVDLGFKFDDQRNAEYTAMMKHGALLGTVGEQQKLSQEEAEYLESIKDIVADLKDDDETEATGCPDPEFYEDESDWLIPNVKFTPEEIARFQDDLNRNPPRGEVQIVPGGMTIVRTNDWRNEGTEANKRLMRLFKIRDRLFYGMLVLTVMAIVCFIYEVFTHDKTGWCWPMSATTGFLFAATALQYAEVYYRAKTNRIMRGL
jgi:hypothetical protein